MHYLRSNERSHLSLNNYKGHTFDRFRSKINYEILNFSGCGVIYKHKQTKQIRKTKMKVGILYLNGFIEDRILSTHLFGLLAQLVRAADS